MARAVSSAELLDLLFDRAGVGLCLVAPDGSVLRANAEWFRATGYRPPRRTDTMGSLSWTRPG